MSNETTEYYGCEAFRGKVNIRLFNDIIGFIAGAAAESPSKVLGYLKDTHLWYDISSTESIQQQFGFRYFGEMLERYEERVSSDIADIRAIALAMAYAKNLLSEDMFVGSQKSNFIRKIAALSDTDIYLKGALYQLKKGEPNTRELADSLTQASYINTEELVFVISLFDDFEQAFTVFKPQLIHLLGSERSIDVVGNEGIYCWLIKCLRQSPWFKEIRKKDIAIFRAITELPVSFVKEGSRHHNILLENGYTSANITYLNSVAVRRRPTNDTMDIDSIVAEKIAIEICTSYINCESSHQSGVYEHLAWLLKKYDSFAIKISGYKGIYPAIQCSIKLTNPQTFIWLYKLTREKHLNGNALLPDEKFNFDILDEKWDTLSNELDAESYRRLFNNQLTAKRNTLSREQVEEQLCKYNVLTRESYLAYFEKEHSWTHKSMFALLVEKSIINLTTAFESCPGLAYISADTSKECRPAMLEYINDYIEGLHSRESFEFLRSFIHGYGFAGMQRLFAIYEYGRLDSFFVKSFYNGPIRYHGEQGKPRFNLKRSFLTADEQCEIFGWLDDYMIQYKTSEYVEFATLMLSDDYITELFPHDELRRIYDMVRELDSVKKSDSVSNSLKNRYLTEAELQADQDAKNARKAEQDRLERENAHQALRDEINAVYDGTFKSIHKFLEKHKFSWKNDDDAAILAEEYLRRSLIENKYVLGKNDIRYFLRVSAKLMKKNVLTFNSFKNYIFIMEESEVVIDAKND